MFEVYEYLAFLHFLKFNSWCLKDFEGYITITWWTPHEFSWLKIAIACRWGPSPRPCLCSSRGPWPSSSRPGWRWKVRRPTGRNREGCRRPPGDVWCLYIFFQDCDWITLWYTNRAMENHRFNRQIPYKYSAELSRGSTCKWFRFVMVFSRGKKQEMKKMWKINDGKNKWKEMKINNKLKGTRKWNKPWM